ncbi:hypothetical protein ABTK99_20070, partial [Acinetobacter baumannii]
PQDKVAAEGITQLLLKKNADPNAISAVGSSPLTYLLDNSGRQEIHTEIILIFGHLIRSGANEHGLNGYDFNPEYKNYLLQA